MTRRRAAANDRGNHLAGGIQQVPSPQPTEEIFRHEMPVDQVALCKDANAG